MQFTAGAHSITIDPPQYGYTVEVRMGTRIERVSTGYKIWDNGLEYTYRVLKLSRHILGVNQMWSVVEFFRNAAKGRMNTVTMALGANPSGFFPGGPDWGDKGNFTVRALKEKQSGVLINPWQRFSEELELLIVTHPEYALPTQCKQGSMRVGNVSDLRFPEASFTVNVARSYVQSVSEGGIPGGVDLGNGADVYETEFDLSCNQSKAAAVIDDLVNNTRTAQTEIAAGSNSFVFGVDKGNGTHDVKLIQNVIEIKHDEYDQFTIPLKFWLMP